MTSPLIWTPSRYLPGEFEAEAGGVCYRVSSFGSTFTNPGAWYASADARHLGRFPYTPTGRQEAFAACEAEALRLEAGGGAEDAAATPSIDGMPFANVA